MPGNRRWLNVVAKASKAFHEILPLLRSELYDQPPAQMDRSAIAVALSGIGPEAKAAVPSLLRANVRQDAAKALKRIDR